MSLGKLALHSIKSVPNGCSCVAIKYESDLLGGLLRKKARTEAHACVDR